MHRPVAMSSGSPSLLILAAFALTSLASLTNAACNSPRETDGGTTEDLRRSPYGPGGPYGGYRGGDLADDSSEF